MAFVQQTLSVIPLIQTFSATSHTQKVYRGLADRGVDIAGRAALVNQGVLLVGGLTVAGATSAVLVVGGLKVLSGEITLGVLVVFLAYLKTISQSVEACLTAMAKVIAANAGLKRVCEILDEDPGIADAPDAVPYRKPEGVRAGRITFESVSFGYAGRESVLDRIDLDIEPGQTVALVGPSGGGKSTLVSLIPRFFDPERGPHPDRRAGFAIADALEPARADFRRPAGAVPVADVGRRQHRLRPQGLQPRRSRGRGRRRRRARLHPRAAGRVRHHRRRERNLRHSPRQWCRTLAQMTTPRHRFVAAVVLGVIGDIVGHRHRQQEGLLQLKVSHTSKVASGDWDRRN